MTDVAFEGGSARYWISLPGAPAPLVAQAAVRPGTPLIRPGATVSASFEADEALVLDA